MSNSSLVNYTKISPNKTSPRNNSIKKITIHHMAGCLSVETCGNVFASSSANASANYGIGTDGRVGMYVEEKDRSWCSSNAANDHQAITIEVANSSTGGDWPVSDIALAKLIDLCVDICQRNGISRLTYAGDSTGNLTKHNMFAATTCPGPYLESKFDYIAEEVNNRIGSDEVSAPAETNAGVSGSGSSTSAATEADLKKEGIKKYQTWLNSFGGYGLVVDGIFGAKTRTAAVKAMQKIIGVAADGIWGAKSKAACVTLKSGSSGNAVYVLQGMLYCRGYVYSGFDGDFGAKTENEVKSYQGANGLSTDGLAGKDTFTELLAA